MPHGTGRAGLLAVALAAGSVAGAPAAAQFPLERLLPGGPARERAAPEAGGVPFLVRFDGQARGLEQGAAVEIGGIRVGTVQGVRLAYQAEPRRFVVSSEILLRPEALPAIDGRPMRTPEEVVAAVEALVRDGLRARLGSTRPLGGETIIVLAMLPEAPAPDRTRGAGLPEIPTAPSRAEETGDRLQDLLDRLSRAPVEDMVADLQAAMAALKALATGPELRETLGSLRDGAAELRGQTARLGARLDPILSSINETVRTANRSLGTFDRQIGDRSPLLLELNAALRELNGAARSLRLMAEYLERNPDALLRGKSDNRR